MLCCMDTWLTHKETVTMVPPIRLGGPASIKDQNLSEPANSNDYK